MNMHLQALNFEKNKILAPYTTFKIGGPADFFVEASSPEELSLAVCEARRLRFPYLILGRGANILIPDAGFRGLVIHNVSKKIEFLNDNLIQTESGVLISSLIANCLQKNLSGFEYFAGIPSTVGGALWNNLHFLSPDRTKTIFISEIIESAIILDENNEARKVSREYFEFDYDKSILQVKPVVILSVTFRLYLKPRLMIQKIIDENLIWRKEKQPTLDEYPSAGSIFKKIDKIGAGRLIEQAGLKGRTIGQAMISTKHANFIVNLGQAKAQDVLELIQLIQQTVDKKFGYHLEPEIKII